MALSAVGLTGLASAHNPWEKNPYAHDFDSAYHDHISYSSRRSWDINWIVCHVTDGAFSGAVNWFKDPNNPYDTSAHYVIRHSDGYCKQMVKDEDIAHHAAGFNSNSIGIEHEWYSGLGEVSDAAMSRSASIVKHVAAEYDIPLNYYTDPYAAANASGGIIGHANAPKYGDPSNTSGKTCPQPGWNWSRYMDHVGGSSGDGGGGGGGGGGSYGWTYHSRGETSEAVYSIQYLLEQHNHDLQYHDGIYGSEVENNIIWFQDARGLSADGVVGPNTWEHLYVTVGPNDDPWWGTYAVQHHLRYGQGYSIAVDGYYGPETRGAIESFQSAAGIGVDGIVGPNTWKALLNL